MARSAAKSRYFPSGGAFKRHVSFKPKGRANVDLPADHPAHAEARTLFPKSVVDPGDSPRLLVSGHNSRKIGARVVKGAWKGLPIYTLTLEERATCPRSCPTWSSCYGNNMPFARRHRAGPEFEMFLAEDMRETAAKHPGGFVVRVHVLGDFYSLDYVALWHEFMRAFPGLRVFGYTSHAPWSPIGLALHAIGEEFAGRWAVRFSGYETEIIDAPGEESAGAIVCPAQTGATDCCGTCALCWQSDKSIAFVRH